MIRLAHHFVMIASLSVIAQGISKAETVHPAKVLYYECEVMRALAGNGRPAAYNAKQAPAIKIRRERIIAYTKSHSGVDLDALNWGKAIKSIYSTSAAREWRTYAESEANVREAWEVLARTTTDDAHLAADLSLEVAKRHIDQWSVRESEACATFMDETESKLLGRVSPQGLSGWKWVAPSFEESFIHGANSLSPERRTALWKRRDAGLMRQLQDETISINNRSDVLASYATQLYSQGEAERAVPLLEAWWAKHRELIKSPQFYSARFHVACYGTGDWSKARETLRRMDQLVVDGAMSADEGLYKLVASNYYKNITHPDYDLKRRAKIINTDKMETFLSIIWK